MPEVRFENPPINEVVCGLQFRPIPRLRAAHIGLIWDEFRNEYPNLSEAPPLSPVFEVFDDNPPSQRNEIVLSELPPLPRTWFISSDDSRLIQLQPDRFLHNWRERKHGDDYPRYARLIAQFHELLSRFNTRIEELTGQSLQYTQYELTYINHIYCGEGWSTFADIGNIFRDFSWTGSSRFLPTPKSINWRSTFELPDKAGRLHSTIRTAALVSDSRPLFQHELTARGFPIVHPQQEDSIREWFDLAHEWIVNSFVDLAHDEIKANVWKLQE